MARLGVLIPPTPPLHSVDPPFITFDTSIPVDAAITAGTNVSIRPRAIAIIIDRPSHHQEEVAALAVAFFVSPCSLSFRLRQGPAGWFR